MPRQYPAATIAASAMYPTATTEDPPARPLPVPEAPRAAIHHRACLHAMEPMERELGRPSPPARVDQGPIASRRSSGLTVHRRRFPNSTCHRSTRSLRPWVRLPVSCHEIAEERHRPERGQRRTGNNPATTSSPRLVADFGRRPAPRTRGDESHQTTGNASPTWLCTTKLPNTTAGRSIHRSPSSNAHAATMNVPNARITTSGFQGCGAGPAPSERSSNVRGIATQRAPQAGDAIPDPQRDRHRDTVEHHRGHRQGQAGVPRAAGTALRRGRRARARGGTTRTASTGR